MVNGAPARRANRHDDTGSEPTVAHSDSLPSLVVSLRFVGGYGKSLPATDSSVASFYRRRRVPLNGMRRLRFVCHAALILPAVSFARSRKNLRMALRV